MKFMLLQNYGGVPEGVPPMSEWTPEEIEAHIAYQKDLNAELRERGELVEAQALTTPELAKFVVSDDGAPVVTAAGPRRGRAALRRLQRLRGRRAGGDDRRLHAVAVAGHAGEPGRLVDPRRLAADDRPQHRAAAHEVCAGTQSLHRFMS